MQGCAPMTPCRQYGAQAQYAVDLPKPFGPPLLATGIAGVHPTSGGSDGRGPCQRFRVMPPAPAAAPLALLWVFRCCLVCVCCWACVAGGGTPAFAGCVCANASVTITVVKQSATTNDMTSAECFIRLLSATLCRSTVHTGTRPTSSQHILRRVHNIYSNDCDALPCGVDALERFNTLQRTGTPSRSQNATDESGGSCPSNCSARGRAISISSGAQPG
jgi:hypothetical protein